MPDKTQKTILGDQVKRINAHFRDRYPDFTIEIPHDELHTHRKGMLAYKGFLITWIIGSLGGTEYLEYYRFHRFGDEHVRIHGDGTSEHLDTLDTYFCYDDSIPGDKERAQQEHKEKYAALFRELGDKGLLDPLPVRTIMNTYLVFNDHDTPNV